MSRTLKGNTTGRAASIDLALQREYIRELEYAELEKKRAERRKHLEQEEVNAIWDCIDLEGKESFFAWYDDDNNVPNGGTYQSRIQLIQARIQKLKGLK